ncbi:hypothetical protein BsWGS_13276 [Bradybaena similaris]
MVTTVTWLSPCTYKAELSGRRQFVECTIAASSIASLISGVADYHHVPAATDLDMRHIGHLLTGRSF